MPSPPKKNYLPDSYKVRSGSGLLLCATDDLRDVPRSHCLSPNTIENFLGQPQLIPCGECSRCARRFSATWSTRCIMASRQYVRVCPITLTYRDLPGENRHETKTINDAHRLARRDRSRKWLAAIAELGFTSNNDWERYVLGEDRYAITYDEIVAAVQHVSNNPPRGVPAIHFKHIEWEKRRNAAEYIHYYDHPKKPRIHMKFYYNEMSAFIKRYRALLQRDYPGTPPIKFFVSGELGDDRGRLHWHLLLFNDPGLVWRSPEEWFAHWETAQQTLYKLWGYGFIQLNLADPNAQIAYACKYAAKSAAATKAQAARDPHGKIPVYGGCHRSSQGLGLGYIRNLGRLGGQTQIQVLEKQSAKRGLRVGRYRRLVALPSNPYGYPVRYAEIIPANAETNPVIGRRKGKPVYGALDIRASAELNVGYRCGSGLWLTPPSTLACELLDATPDAERYPKDRGLLFGRALMHLRHKVISGNSDARKGADAPLAPSDGTPVSPVVPPDVPAAASDPVVQRGLDFFQMMAFCLEGETP